MTIKVTLILMMSQQKIKRKILNTNSLNQANIISTKSDKLKLPKWVKVSEKRFNEILSITTEAKNSGLKANVDGEKITPDKAESLLKDISSKKWMDMNLKKITTILSKTQKRY